MEDALEEIRRQVTEKPPEDRRSTCWECGAPTQRTGACSTCTQCGSTDGCG